MLALLQQGYQLQSSFQLSKATQHWIAIGLLELKTARPRSKSCSDSTETPAFYKEEAVD